MLLRKRKRFDNLFKPFNSILVMTKIKIIRKNLLKGISKHVERKVYEDKKIRGKPLKKVIDNLILNESNIPVPEIDVVDKWAQNGVRASTLLNYMVKHIQIKDSLQNECYNCYPKKTQR